MKKILICILFLLLTTISYSQTTIFTETIGTVGATTSIAVHEAANGFDNDPYTMTGTGDIRNTTPSSGYAGSSGLANVFLTNTIGKDFQISGINTIGYSSLSLSFGVYKSTTASNGSELIVEVSTDGVTYTTLTFVLPTGAGTATWYYITPTGTIPATANLRIRFKQNGATPQFRIDDIKLVDSVVSCTAPTISIQPSSYTKCVSESVTFSVTASCASGSISYQWRKNGTNIGGATSSTYNIPSVVVGDAGNYDVIVTCVCGANPTTTSSVGTLTVNGTCIYPHMTGCLINSCNGTCQEGNNEILFFNSGSVNVSVTPANIKVYYENANPATVNYTESFVSNATYVQGLNDSSTCGTIFYDGLTVGTIPANSVFMIMRSDPCYPYNLSDFCGQGNIYCLFTSDASWIVGGNFVNSASGVRYFRTNINGYIIDYSYDSNLLTLHNDGDAIAFPSNGGVACSYFNDGCIPPPVVLPITLLSFTTQCENNSRKIIWQTAMENNVDRFEIYRSLDAINYELIYTENNPGNSLMGEGYVVYDNELILGNVYYRLKSIDNDGYQETFESISINCNTTNIIVHPNPATNGENVSIIGDVYSIEVYDVIGRKINIQITNGQITGIPNGVYILHINGKLQIKIIII